MGTEMILVNKGALVSILQALDGFGHEIRELQVLRNMPSSPIAMLRKNFEDSLCVDSGMPPLIGAGLRSEMALIIHSLGNPSEIDKKDVGVWLLMIKQTLDEAVRLYYKDVGNYSTLVELRKATALGLSCGLQYEYPVREGYSHVVNG